MTIQRRVSLNKNVTYGLDISKLQEIEKQLGKSMGVRIGILGDRSDRESIMRNSSGEAVQTGEKSTLTNGDIGAIHEFGSYSANIPKRSFLMMPLELKVPGIARKLGADFLAGLTAGNAKTQFKRMGVLFENIVRGAFNTGGYGRWPDIKQSTKDRKGSSRILVDSAQLSGAITSKVI